MVVNVGGRGAEAGERNCFYYSGSCSCWGFIMCPSFLFNLSYYVLVIIAKRTRVYVAASGVVCVWGVWVGELLLRRQLWQVK